MSTLGTGQGLEERLEVGGGQFQFARLRVAQELTDEILLCLGSTSSMSKSKVMKRRFFGSEV